MKQNEFMIKDLISKFVFHHVHRILFIVKYELSSAMIYFQLTIR
jgi:hypothetical protein